MKEFTKEYLFLSFSSKDGCAFDLTVYPPPHRAALPSASILDPYVDFLPKSDPYCMEISNYQKKREQLLQRIRNEGSEPQLSQSVWVRHSRQAQVIEKREQLELEKQRMKMFLVNKWAFLKHIKAHMLSQNRSRLQKQRAVRHLAILVLTGKHLRRLGEFAIDHIAHVIRKRRLTEIIAIVQTNLKRQLRNQGPYLKDRLLR